MHLRYAAAFLASVCAAAPADAQLTVRLTGVPPSTPAGATIYVAGSFNGWNPGDAAYALAVTPGGGYAITLPDSVRGAVEFKFTLGSWETVETTAAGGDVPNRSVTIPAAGAATATARVEGWRNGKPPAPRHSTRSASVSVLSDSFPIPQLARTRRVWIYLPPGYDTSSTRYPVLYMHDGQNVFDDSTSFVGEWGVDESLDSLRALGDRGVIVVAVDHGASRRLDEYDPWRNPNPRLGGGEGDAYVEFLVQTLKPYIDGHYRTLPDREHTGIMGSSMGGLISLYAALKHPDVFGRVGVFSCACWVADPPIFAYARRARPPRPPPRFYFVAGELEATDRRPVRDQQRVIDTLVAAGFPRAALRSLVAADGKHAEWFWRREFPAAYRWLFRDTSTSFGRNTHRRAHASYTVSTATSLLRPISVATAAGRALRRADGRVRGRRRRGAAPRHHSASRGARRARRPTSPAGRRAAGRPG